MNLNLIKLTLLCAGLICGTVHAFAQSRSQSGRTFTFSLQEQQVSVKSAESRLNELLHLSGDFTYVKGKERTDVNGIRHTTYAQYYAGIKVEEGTVLVHSRNGVVLSMNGNIMNTPGTRPNLVPVIDPRKAIETAKKELNITTTVLSPTPELVLYLTAREPELVYKTRIDGMANNKLLMYNVYISAIDGRVIRKLSLIAFGDVPATAQTYYSGVRPIITDSFSGGYRLRDNRRKIETYDVKGQTFNQSSAPAFTNPNDVINNSTTWSNSLFLKSVTLLKAADSARFTGFFDFNGMQFGGWFLTSKIEAQTGPSTFQSVSERTHPQISFMAPPTPVTIPFTDAGIDIPLTASGYRGTFRKDSAALTFGPGGFQTVVLKSDTNIIQYRIDTLTPGTHNWSNAHGDKGTYNIALQANPAVDVHWGMEQTYDFYKTKFSYYSYDNDSASVIRNYYNGADIIAGDVNNAMALPSPYFAMAYGAGDEQMFHPVVALDVEGHEFTHLITGSNANLNYSGESGALNESFSDMMGTAIVYFAKGVDSVTWHVGDRVGVTMPYMRSLSNPKAPAGFTNGRPQPDTYLGQYWADTTDNGQQNDNGGVHTNSGVGNKWFYLLAHGGSGTNDNQYAYNITALGMAKAQQIAFTTFTDHLTQTSRYLDAYNESLQVTANLYGQSSTEYSTVKEAWKAVGIPKSATGVGSAATVAGGIELSPNPSDGRFQIQSSLSNVIDADIYSITGEKLLTTKVKSGSNQLDLSTFSKGLYLIVYKVDQTTHTQKLILR